MSGALQFPYGVAAPARRIRCHPPASGIGDSDPTFGWLRAQDLHAMMAQAKPRYAPCQFHVRIVHHRGTCALREVESSVPLVQGTEILVLSTYDEQNVFGVLDGHMAAQSLRHGHNVPLVGRLVQHLRANELGALWSWNLSPHESIPLRSFDGAATLRTHTLARWSWHVVQLLSTFDNLFMPCFLEPPRGPERF